MMRLQVEIDDKYAEEIQKLMADCGLRTKKELFNNAFTAFQWLVKQVKDGAVVISINENTKTQKEFEMPALSAARKRL